MKRDTEKLQAFFNDAKHAYTQIGWTIGAYFRGRYDQVVEAPRALNACFIGAVAYGGGHTVHHINGELYAAGADPDQLMKINDSCSTKEEALKKIADFMGVEL